MGWPVPTELATAVVPEAIPLKLSMLMNQTYTSQEWFNGKS
jgi:hypothetical protein